MPPPLRKVFLSLFLFYPLLAFAFPPSYYADKSKLSTGHWVKISVAQTGIHQISYDDLRRFGFDNPEAVSMFGYGGASLTSNAFSTDHPDDIIPTQTLHTTDGRILFYGEADLSLSAPSFSLLETRRNLYDKKGYYFLSDSYPRDSQTIDGDSDVDPTLTELDHHISISYIENETQNPADGGAVFHDAPMKQDETRYYDFEIFGFEKTSAYPYARFSYSFAAYSSTNTRLEITFPQEFSIQSSNNGNAPLQTQENKFYSTGSGLARISDVEKDDVYSIGFRIAQGCAPTYAAIDKAYITYPRRNSFPKGDSPQLTMNFHNVEGCIARIDKASPTTFVWDITNATNVIPCPKSYDPATSSLHIAFPGAREIGHYHRKLIAFDQSSAYPSATFAGEVCNQNLHGCQVPDMVIITTDALVDPAERLAELHRKHDGIDVAVVTQNSIFNEFSSGCRSAMAYRRYFKMLYDRQPDKIKYVLLYGHSSWNNRRNSSIEELLCYETEVVEQARDLTKNYTSDKYFVMLEDSFNENRIPFGKMNLAIGRLDVSSVTEGDKVNAKIERFMNRPRSHAVYGNVLVMSDDGDNQRHFLDAEETIVGMDSINPTLTFTRAHNLIYPWSSLVSIEGRKSITSALKTGQGFMFYYGHSSLTSLTGEKLYDLNLISQAHCDDYPFALLATCETFGFDRNYKALGQSMLNDERGGAIAVIGSSRSVFMEYNKSFAQAVANAYAAATPQTTIGDIVRDAHNFCINNYSEVDRAVNAMCYNLCGDPALKLGAPNLEITIDAIDGNQPNDDGTMILSPLKPLRIEGHIVGTNGIISEFDGEAIIRIYDTPLTVETYEKKGSDKNRYPVTLDEKIVAQQKTCVTQGKFAVDITAPLPDGKPGNNRIVISALSNDRTQNATATLTNCRIAENADGIIDRSAPEILEMYIDSPSFSDGDITGKSVIVYATIVQPASGLDLSSGIGSAPSLKLDDRLSFDIAAKSLTTNTDGTASFSLPVENLADGKHELKLTVRSNAGTTSSRTVGFIVCDSSVDASLSTDSKLARQSVTILLDHSFSSQPTGRLIIEDSEGRTVFSADNCTLPFEWDLTDSKGNDVPDGRYRAYALLHDEFNYASTPKIEIVVIR